MRVADLMTADVTECAPEESIRAAAHRMNEFHCGCLPVLVSDGDERRLVGIITDRDVTCRAAAQGLDLEHTEISRCMSFPVHTITGDADLCACAERFATINVRRLVVVDDQNHCLGIISRADLQRFVSEQPGSDPSESTPQSPMSPPASHEAMADNEPFPTSVPERSNPELTL